MSEKKGGFKEFVEAGATVAIIAVAAKTAIAYAGTPDHENSTKPDVKPRSDHANNKTESHHVTPKNPKDVTVHSRLSRSSAEKLFGVNLQETVVMGNSASNPTHAEVKGIKHVAYVIGKNSYGWGEKQDECLAELWTNESNWRGNAYNDATATGIPQALWKLHGPKIEQEFPDYQDNVVEQVQWGEEYIKGRYGNPCDANYAWWHNYDPNGHHWY